MYFIVVKYDWKICLYILAGVIYPVNFLQWESLYNHINILCFWKDDSDFESDKSSLTPAKAGTVKPENFYCCKC